MANSDRRIINRDGKTFMPMNMDSGVWEGNFFNSTKLITIAILVLGLVGALMFINSTAGSVIGKVILGLFPVFIFQLLLRKVVFEEEYYLKMHRNLKKNEITTPAIFWDIAGISETEEGAILTYSDLKIGVVVRLERDTILGKKESFVEDHYDAISDFYKEINIKGYSFVQLNIMEQAGKDPRLAQLDELSTKTDNQNLARLIEMQVGHIKNITRATLFEYDYVLIYTRRSRDIDRIISDATDCVYKVMDGGYSGFKILDPKDITELIKEMYGVKYFDYSEATVDMFKNNGMALGKIFKLSGIRLASGKEIKLNEKEINRLNTLASYINKGDLRSGDWSIEEALQGKLRRGKLDAEQSDSNGSNETLGGISLDDSLGLEMVETGYAEAREEKSEIPGILKDKKRISKRKKNQLKNKSGVDVGNEQPESDDEIVF